MNLLDQVYQSAERYVGRSHPVKLRRGNGGALEECFFDFVFQPIFDVSGQVNGIAVVAFEVTELVRARRAAEEASRAKDEFLAMLGHELRNPLAPILTALQLLRIRGETGGAHERAVIERQARHLVGLVDDLLDVSRITRGKVRLKLSRVELHDVVVRGIELASPLLEQHQHELFLEIADRGLPVLADTGRLAQVVGNLLTNAAKYTPAGGRIQLSAREEDGQVVLRVADTGIGIDAEMLPQVFDLFAQDRQAIDRAQGGLGLGLAIVRSLVSLHGGSVSARSEGRGRGSEFVIRLPRAGADGAAAAGEAERVAHEAIRTARRVLIVDDNVDAASLLAELLSELGHATEWANDGPSALAAAARFRPDLALLDIGLPVMDGFELARQMRRVPELPRLRLVAVTGYGQEHDRVRAAEAGFDAHLVKPVHVEQLAPLLQQLAQRRD
jgi:signal transduction histidine kinase/ActR/RegA family two-component response regulator